MVFFLKYEMYVPRAHLKKGTQIPTIIVIIY